MIVDSAASEHDRSLKRAQDLDDCGQWKDVSARTDLQRATSECEIPPLNMHLGIIEDAKADNYAIRFRASDFYFSI